VLLMPVRITGVKNIEFALRVVQQLRSSGLVARLVVTGPPDPHAPDVGDYYRHVLDLREQLSLQEEACFVYEGTVKNPGPLVINASAVAELYRLADLILMPSLREGFGIPVLEAAMVDRPVFATSIPVTQDLPDFQHLIGKDEPPDSVARRIVRWAETDSRHRLRRIVRRDYTWSGIFTKRILPLIDGIQRGQIGGGR
jgi:mannosylglucosylglycerate synthase